MQQKPQNKFQQQWQTDDFGATFVPDKKDVFKDADEEEKNEVYNQFKPKPKQFTLPDPSISKKYDMNAPIKLNPTGNYNLNFIDWSNEWEKIIDRDQNTYESPIFGMDNETFEKIYDEYF